MSAGQTSEALTSSGKGLAAIKDTDIVEPKKTAREQMVAARVFTIDPPKYLSDESYLFNKPVEVQEQLVETACKERAVTLAAGSGFLVHAVHCPSVHWRVDIVKSPLVSVQRQSNKHTTIIRDGGLRRQLTIRVHVPLPQEESQLMLGKLRVDNTEWHHVESQVPQCIPRVLPLVLVQSVRRRRRHWEIPAC